MDRNKQHGSILGFDRKKVIVNPFFLTHTATFQFTNILLG